MTQPGSNERQAPPDVLPVISTVLATANLGCELRLRRIALNICNTVYDPRRSHAASVRIKEPPAVVQVHASGKVVVTGAKSEEGAHLAAKKVAKLVQNLRFPVVFKAFEVHNVCGACHLGYAVALDSMYRDHSLHCSYEKELWAGLRYTLEDPKVAVDVYTSGNVVFKGAKSTAILNEAFHRIHAIAVRYRTAPASEQEASPPAMLKAAPAAVVYPYFQAAM